MTKSKEQIITDIKDFMAKYGGLAKDWYVGIASDPEDRLFNGHSVDKQNDVWIYRWADSTDVAREIEDYFVNDLGTAGDVGGGDYNSKSVYAYKIASHTVE